VKYALTDLSSTTDSADDLAVVWRFLQLYVTPRVAAIADGTVRPDCFFREFPEDGLALLSNQTKNKQQQQQQQQQDNSHQSWARLGDTGKVVVLLLCLLFLGSVALHELGLAASFSQAYLADGFCISNKQDSPFLQSHMLSFAADTVMTGWMCFLVRRGRQKEGMLENALAPIAKNSISLFGHGVGHLFLAMLPIFSSQDPSLTAQGDWAEDLLGRKDANIVRLCLFASFLPVWYGFMRDRERSVVCTLSFAVSHNALQIFVLPPRFFFTHVLLAVLGNSAIRWMCKEETKKSKYYAMETWLVDVPILFASFGEALSCDAFLVSVGGHVWFDMVVPVMFTVYYVLLLLDPKESTASISSHHSFVNRNNKNNNNRKKITPTPSMVRQNKQLFCAAPLVRTSSKTK